MSDRLYFDFNQWRDIPKIPGEKWEELNDDYAVSNYGRVVSKKTGKYRFMTPYLTKYGLEVNLDGKKAYVHRLVAENFIYNKNGYKYVIHKDNDYTNNKYDNLEWVSMETIQINRYARAKRQKV